MQINKHVEVSSWVMELALAKADKYQESYMKTGF